MARYLVTGGAGFIGSHLVDRLIARGDEVVVLDNFNDFYDPAIKRRNIASHARNPSWSLVEGDLRNPGDCARCFESGPIDQIVHLAAMAGVRPSLKDPGLYVDVNLRGTVNLYDAALAAGVKNVVFASSSSVYGANEKVPFHEADPVDNPVSPYAATKKAGELLAHTYHHIHGMDIACLRFFTVYGPRQRPEMAIHKFARLIEDGKSIPMFGDGQSRRDYTYIDDIIDGVLRTMERSKGFRVYNLGESQTIELRELIEVLEESLGKKAKIDRQPFQPGDVPATFADVSRAREELGYRPTTDVREGVRKFVAWMRAEPETKV
ncbi:MAG: GDP-mannose 4,6-dehydratase [Planctomycetes bacterium]|nr:GDP-mannose 4,6-dehydratase [Planctomycetota bacterium]